MRRPARAARGLVVVAGVLLGALAASVLAAGAQQAGTRDLVVRAIDGRDPDAVEVEFLWTGDRDRVPDAVIRENGEVVESTTPVRLDSEQRFGIVLAIDTSGSMADGAAFERAQEAAKEFIANKEPGDQIAIVSFNDVVQVMTRFTDDDEALVDAVDRLGLSGFTALYDGVRRSVNLFQDTDLVPNVVVVTDGRDSSSEASEAVAANLLDESNTLLHAVAIETEDLDLGVLERLTSATGGTVLTSSDPSDLSRLYADVQERMRQQFRATFVSETEREGPSTVVVSLGAVSDEASYTPGARLDSTQLVEPVPIPTDRGIDLFQGEAFLWVGILLVLFAMAAAVFAIGSAITREGPRLDRVLQPYSDGFVAPSEADEDRLATSALLQRAVELTGDFAQRRGVLQRVEDLLERANLPLRAAEALFFYAVASLVLALLGGVVTGGPAGGVVVLVLAVLVPPGVVMVLGRRRHAQFQAQLPDMLALLASTLRAGYSLMQGVEAAAQEVQEPMRRELQRVVSESRLGMPLEEALFNVSARMRSRDFEWAVMAISIQREVGGNLAELLDIVGDTMRARERLRRDISALTAEGRVSAVVLGALPFGIGAVIYSLNADYLDPLFERGEGLLMLGGAGVLMGIGFFWMYRVIDIEV